MKYINIYSLKIKCRQGRFFLSFLTGALEMAQDDGLDLEDIDFLGRSGCLDGDFGFCGAAEGLLCGRAHSLI